jgi:hypothetical protein
MHEIGITDHLILYFLSALDFKSIIIPKRYNGKPTIVHNGFMQIKVDKMIMVRDVDVFAAFSFSVIFSCSETGEEVIVLSTIVPPLSEYKEGVLGLALIVAE